MAYRRTERTLARLEDNRRRILDAAREIVASGGFAQVQMAGIAREASVATGTLYRYFPSKDHLVLEIFRDISDQEMGLVEQIAAGAGDPEERLAKAVRTFASRALRAPKLAYALLSEPVEGLLAEERLAYRRKHAAALERIIRDGIAAGGFAPQDPAFTALCLAAAIPTAVTMPADSAGTVDNLVAFCRNAAKAGGPT